jgi:hypothetical protein
MRLPYKIGGDTVFRNPPALLLKCPFLSLGVIVIHRRGSISCVLFNIPPSENHT